MTTMATSTADTATSATRTMTKSWMFTVIHKTATKRKKTMQKNAGNTTHGASNNAGIVLA